ncbi:S8 family serine peptidase [Streptomyces sp. PT12]|uniref:S8 family serine peptidase n=1 Tax=Streptomyces sp. PT12 TaxID=1510197 RepID=UPI000DE27B04|nr:S8 family serine peptidase [Streptomyces sp. PT12]RBM04858.1 hypothetical protein DEH69_29195 [Streptomyces sp. PT12]
MTVAVLDTGIDASHPDLAGGKVVAEASFAGTPDAHDHHGHGTHVASIAAGTGARSDGAHSGVAPRARLLNARVLDDEGWGFDSGIVQGMEWAVAQDAQVVDRLSAESGAPIVIAAGNDGPGQVSSPATADAALAALPTISTRTRRPS